MTQPTVSMEICLGAIDQFLVDENSCKRAGSRLAKSCNAARTAGPDQSANAARLQGLSTTHVALTCADGTESGAGGHAGHRRPAVRRSRCRRRSALHVARIEGPPRLRTLHACKHTTGAGARSKRASYELYNLFLGGVYGARPPPRTIPLIGPAPGTSRGAPAAYRRRCVRAGEAGALTASSRPSTRRTAAVTRASDGSTISSRLRDV